jgi:DnaJ-class molecular chaperone
MLFLRYRTQKDLKMFCSKCAGCGEIMGNGMIMMDCPKCDGYGEYHETKPANDDKSEMKIDKRSSHYKDAIKEIMELNPKLSRQKAAKMFEDTYDKV